MASTFSGLFAPFSAMNLLAGNHFMSPPSTLVQANPPHVCRRLRTGKKPPKWHDKRLTALKVKSLEKPGRYADGHNLWLQISENGGKSWVLRYMLDGKARHMGLGPLHTVSLAEARERAREARKLLLDGRD